MTKHDNMRQQRDEGPRDLDDWLERMMPVLRATVEVELMRKRALGLPISVARERRGEGRAAGAALTAPRS